MTLRSLLAAVAMFACTADATSEPATVADPGKPRPIRTSKPPADVLRKELTSLQWKVTQENGTEVPFRNAFHDHKEPGIYVDVTTGQPLFSSLEKFDSGTGWPSFYKPLEPGEIVEHRDSSHGMVRIEVRSKTGDAHLGHVFDDGPRPTGLRYCINSAALRFIPADQLEAHGYGKYRPRYATPKR